MTDEEDVVAPLQAAEAATGDPLALLRHWDESQQRTVLCDPAVEDAVRQAVERYNLGHLFKVQTSDVIPDGSVIVVNGHAIEANMREVLRDGIAPRPASYWRADYRAIVDATWRGEFACPTTLGVSIRSWPTTWRTLTDPGRFAAWTGARAASRTRRQSPRAKRAPNDRPIPLR